MSRLYIGIDNGTSGSIGFYGESYAEFYLTPVKEELNYTKSKKFIKRIDQLALKNMLIENIKAANYELRNCLVIMERPYTGPQTNTVISGARAFESTLLAIEELGIPYRYTDSREWQKSVLPKGIVGSVELKKASKEIGCRLLGENFIKLIKSHKDADGFLIAYNAYQQKY